MSKKQLFTVTDLGGGDGGKGGIVHKLCVEHDAHTVLKVGGAQGSHGVRTANGQRFNFSQFGCGTFDGVKTHITNLMVIEPQRLMNEARQLREEWRISDIYDYLTVDEDCLCVTPFHTIASRIHELARKDKPKGTIGVGVGEAVLDAELHPELAIRAKDLGKPGLYEKLEAVRLQKLNELRPIIESPDNFWSADHDLARKEIEYLTNPRFADWSAGEFTRMTKEVRIVDTGYLEEEILSEEGTVVVESSHGILTDRYHGFHPHVSRTRTLPQATFDLLKERGYDGEVIPLGVTRAYQIRHGAGPMVTESSEMLERLLPGSNKDENRWQGKVRVGPLDLVALRYSIAVCGGPEVFKGLAVSWFDQIAKNGRWDVCDAYEGATDNNYFSPTGEILVRCGTDQKQVEHQEELGRQLNHCRPVITSYDLKGMGEDEVVDLCSRVLEEKLRVKVRMISLGSTEEDKRCL